jgi:hypothetical protein
MNGVMAARGARVVLALVITVSVAVAAVMVGAPGTGTGADGSAGFLAFKDASAGSSMSVGLQDAGAARGRFEFAVDGVGLFWPADVATVAVKSDSSVIVRYDGPGFLDARAQLDDTFGFHKRSGDWTKVDIRLEAQVNPDRITASATLWSGAQQFVMVDRRPTPDADQDLATILDTVRRSDWSALYGWLYAGARATTTESAFVEQTRAAFTARGTVVAVDRVGVLSYGDGRAGFDTASQAVTLTMSSGGNQTTLHATASLVWETNRWSLLSIAPDS